MGSRVFSAVGVVIAAVLVVGGVFFLLHGGKTQSLADQRFIAITDQNPTLAGMDLHKRIALGHDYCAHRSLPSLTQSELHTLRIAAVAAYCP